MDDLLEPKLLELRQRVGGTPPTRTVNEVSLLAIQLFQSLRKITAIEVNVCRASDVPHRELFGCAHVEHGDIALGNQLTHIVNGHVMAILIDDDPEARKMKGVIALQIEQYGLGKVSFRNIWLKQ